MLIKRTSLFTGKSHVRDIPITEAQWKAYLKYGIKVQHAFPHLSPDDREFIMTGITPEEWTKTFKNINDGE